MASCTRCTGDFTPNEMIAANSHGQFHQKCVIESPALGAMSFIYKRFTTHA